MLGKFGFNKPMTESDDNVDKSVESSQESSPTTTNLLPVKKARQDEDGEEDDEEWILKTNLTVKEKPLSWHSYFNILSVPCDFHSLSALPSSSSSSSSSFLSQSFFKEISYNYNSIKTSSSGTESMIIKNDDEVSDMERVGLELLKKNYRRASRVLHPDKPNGSKIGFQLSVDALEVSTPSPTPTSSFKIVNICGLTFRLVLF
jgi:hypothetical protein